MAKVTEIRVRPFLVDGNTYYKYRLVEDSKFVDLKVGDVAKLIRIKFVFTKSMTSKDRVKVLNKWKHKQLH